MLMFLLKKGPDEIQKFKTLFQDVFLRHNFNLVEVVFIKVKDTSM